MPSLLKNILLLALLLGLGLVLLGAFNAGVKVKGDTSVYKTIATTWDTYLDTSSWKAWRHPDLEVVWDSGKPGKVGGSWSFDDLTIGRVEARINDMIKDSMVVIQSTGRGGWKMEEVATFTLDNGQCRIDVERRYEVDGFLPNVALNWELSTLEKSLENELKAFKALFESKDEDS
jgi:hypothetical protein